MFHLSPNCIDRSMLTRWLGLTFTQRRTGVIVDIVNELWEVSRTIEATIIDTDNTYRPYLHVLRSRTCFSFTSTGLSSTTIEYMTFKVIGSTMSFSNYRDVESTPNLIDNTWVVTRATPWGLDGRHRRRGASEERILTTLGLGSLEDVDVMIIEKYMKIGEKRVEEF